MRPLTQRDQSHPTLAALSKMSHVQHSVKFDVGVAMSCRGQSFLLWRQWGAELMCRKRTKLLMRLKMLVPLYMCH